MLGPEQLRKHALECLRLEADCMQLAGDAPNRNLQSHFLRMAQAWLALALSEPDVIAARELSEGETQATLTGGKLPPRAILVVEDDQLLKLLTVEMVEEAGFPALQASNADEAVAILEARSDIALLLTDINMPGSMDGLKLAHAVRNRWPPVKIIVISGRVPQYDLPADSRFFAKPYQTEILISEIRSLIGP